MILTTKTRYAILAILSILDEKQVYSLQAIADAQKIPHSYLEQIFLKLKKAGIVSSVRGPGGGYKIATNPSNITLYQVINAIEEKSINFPRCSGDNPCATKNNKCDVHHLWDGIENNITKYLTSLSISDIVKNKITNPNQRIFLDNNSTTILDSSIKEEMMSLFGKNLNPSSLHHNGREAKAIIEGARLNIAKALGIKLGVGEYQIIFTSSGTEANNMLFNNFRNTDVAISVADHLSVLEPAKEFCKAKFIQIDSEGQIDLAHFKSVISELAEGSLISIMSANNETGIIESNMKQIIDMAHQKKLLVHSDAIQSFGKIKFAINDLDFITISSHKINGPIGTAALIYKSNIKLSPYILGGGQERGMRSGTENVPAILGFGLAANLVEQNVSKYAATKVMRDHIESQIKKICPNAKIFGQNTQRLPNTSMIMMPYVEAQQQIIKFDLKNISISSGSACSSGKMKISHVLLAMSAEEQEAKCSIRVSLGTNTTENEITRFIETWQEIYKNQ